MQLERIVEVSRQVAQTRSRLKKRAALAACLREAGTDAAGLVVHYLGGTLPQGRVGIGPTALRRLAGIPGAPVARLTLGEVDAAFSRIAAVAGTGSKAARHDALAALLAAATREEQDFLSRLIHGELRQGALEGVIVDAIAQAAHLPAEAVRRAVMLAGEAPAVAVAALREGVAGLARFRLSPLSPVQPMLAQPAEDIAHAMDALGEAAIEYKLDGARVQIHKSGADVRVFSRSLGDVTGSVPELVDAVRAMRAGALILDGEAIAMRDAKRPHPFQVTMRRFGRRVDVDAMRSTLPLHVFLFDCLHDDGEDLIDRPARDRFACLAEIAPAPLLVPRIETDDPVTAAAFLDAALAAGHEGVMAKSPHAPYAAGSRGAGWLKVKQVHTLDLVVLAAEWGSGRRRGWLSNLHLGARDPRSGGFVMLGKTFKGLTDRMLEWQTARLLALEIGRDGHVVHVRPELVVEIAFNEIQSSPHYPAGMALRFARVKRHRDDKSAREADTVDAVRALHRGRAEHGST